MNTSAPQPSSVSGGSAPSADECTWAMIAHLSAFAGMVVPLVGHIGGPLVVWLAQRDRSAFVERQAKEALNFNLTVALAGLLFTALVLLGIGVTLLAALALVWFILTIVAAIKANEGLDYRYPVALRLIR